MKVETRYGKFSAFSAKDLISRSLLCYGEWAQREIEILRHFISAGDTVVDAGAYIGTHTVAFAQMVGSEGKIHSFEPNRAAHTLLVENVLANAPSNVTVHQSALGETCSQARVGRGGINNLGATRVHPVGNTAKTNVAIQMLDSFRLKTVNFIKADVEGSELMVLRGATATIASSRPRMFLECNSLESIYELPAWLKENEYLSYGLLVEAFNPNNFKRSQENIFGSSKECGLLLIPKERSSSASNALKRLNLPLVTTIDDAVLLLLHKPQYAYEILEKTLVAKIFGIRYPSPALTDALSQNEIKVREFDAEVLDLRNQLGSLQQSRDGSAATEIADHEMQDAQVTEATGNQTDTLTQTIHALQQESLFQRASFYKRAYEASQAHTALERELQEELLQAQREVQSLERESAEKLADYQTEADAKIRDMATKIASLSETNQSLQQEHLLQSSSLYKKAYDTTLSQVALERDLRDQLLSGRLEIETLQKDSAVKLADQQAVAERSARALTEQVGSLTDALQSLQQEAVAQRASFFKQVYEAHQAHVAVERDLQEEIVSTQREMQELNKDWAAKLEIQQGDAEQQLDAITKQLNSLTQSLMLAKEEQLRQELTHSKRELQTIDRQAELEMQLRERVSSHQREIEDLQRDWVAKVNEQQLEAERRVEVVTKQLDSTTQSLLATQEEQIAQQVIHSERILEVSRIRCDVETELQKQLLEAQTKVESLRAAKDELEAEKAAVDASPTWRVLQRVRAIARISFPKSRPRKSWHLITTRSAIQGLTKQTPATSSDIQRPNQSAKFEPTEAAYAGEIQGLLESGLFDRDYYLASYADVATAKIDPLSHYLNYGWREGRNPSNGFDTNFYLESYPDVRESNINPLIHYVKYGRDEKRKKLQTDNLTDISIFFALLHRAKSVRAIVSSLAIDIVIPIYNGFDFLDPLFGSILSNTSIPFRLIIVDDASPDPRVKQFLQELRRTNAAINMLLIENSDNLGFVGSVNRAVKEVRNHFVLLNSDTEVPPNWLERLMYPIFTMEKVASTTPFTNSGTICSFPTYLKDNPLFENLSVDVIDGYFQFVIPEISYLSIPTGIGFCMGINKNVVDQIGMFDEVFGKGYCEENDWCARAEKLGYQNLQVPNLFVYHKHGGSFASEERKRLIQENYSILLKRHPSYDVKVQEFIRMDSLRDLRRCLIMLLASSSVSAIVVVDNELGGGAHQFRKNHIKRVVDEGGAVLLIGYRSNSDKIATLEFSFRTYRFLFSVRSLDDLVSLFGSLRIEEILINSLVSFPNIDEWMTLVAKVRDASNCKVSFLVHDYFSVCPSYTLINNSNEYCGVPRDLDICGDCLLKNTGDFRRFEAHTDILTWRTKWDNFLRGCDEVICFGNSSADVLRRAYPAINSERIIVRPHNIAGRLKQIHFEPWRDTVKTIGVLGGINLSKGSSIVRDLVEYIDRLQLCVRVVLIGEIDLEIESPSFEVTGRYDIESLESLVLEKKIDVFLLPSIWPETFSFTADEIMQMGFPLIVFNIGAPAERVRDYALGKVIEPRDLYTTLFGEERRVMRA